MRKQIIRRSGRTLISWIGLMAIVCVPSFIAGAAHTEIDASSAKWQTIRMRVTAYCPCSKCCGQYADGVTASGHKIEPGDTFVAADKRYSLGTEMVVPGYSNSQTVKVLDRGGAINLISPHSIISKNCAGQATSGYLVDVQRVSEKDYEEWRKMDPEAFDAAFQREYDPASGLRLGGWVEGGMD